MKASRSILPVIPALALGLAALSGATEAAAQISVSPYVSVKSTKSIAPGDKGKGKGTENEVIKQRQEAGLKVGIGFLRIMKFEVGVGQSKLDTTEKVRQAKDEYDQIDYKQDMNMDTSDQDADVKTSETQNVAKASLIVDPSFGIFILRGKAGVTATQRSLRLEQAGHEPTEKTFDPVYKPHLGAGAGVRLGRMAYFMAEYNFNLYKFPQYEPFEREVSISFGVALGGKGGR